MSQMLQINEKIIGLSILEERFVCDLDRCKGGCCVQGDAGAPLMEDEVHVLEEIYPLIKPYLRSQAIDAIELQGTHVIDNSDQEFVTPLLNEKECVYAVFEDGIARCAIEKAWSDKIIEFRKPVSCHLYPIRVKEYENLTAINYDRWPICKPAIANGEKLNVPVFVFCRESVKRRFGEAFYKELEIAAASFATKP